MKVLIYEPAGQGKLAQYSFQLASRLHNKDCQVTLVTSADWEMASNRFEFSTRRIHDPRRGADNCGALLKEVAELRPDIIHWHWFPSIKALKLPSQIKSLYGTKMTATVHNVVPHMCIAGQIPYYRRMYEAMDKIIAHSVYDRETLITALKIDKKMIAILPPGGIVAANSSGPDRARARVEMGIDADAPVLLFFGYINRQKGLEYLIEAAAKLRIKHPKLKLIVAGQPVMAFKAFADLISSSGLGDAVHLDLNYIPPDRTHRYFTAADLIVLPHVGVGQSPIVTTAYQFGKAVVTTYPQWEMVYPGQSGLMVRPGSTEELTEAIDSLLSSPEKLAAMGRNCLDLYKDRFSWEVIAGRTLGVYRGILSGGSE